MITNTFTVPTIPGGATPVGTVDTNSIRNSYNAGVELQKEIRKDTGDNFTFCTVTKSIVNRGVTNLNDTLDSAVNQAITDINCKCGISMPELHIPLISYKCDIVKDKIKDSAKKETLFQKIKRIILAIIEKINIYIKWCKDKIASLKAALLEIKNTIQKALTCPNTILANSPIPVPGTGLVAQASSTINSSVPGVT